MYLRNSNPDRTSVVFFEILALTLTMTLTFQPQSQFHSEPEL
jgi:hypothetical protein